MRSKPLIRFKWFKIASKLCETVFRTHLSLVIVRFILNWFKRLYLSERQFGKQTRDSYFVWSWRSHTKHWYWFLLVLGTLPIFYGTIAPSCDVPQTDSRSLSCGVSEILAMFSYCRTEGNTELIMTGQEQTLSTRSLETRVYNIKTDSEVLTTKKPMRQPKI